MYELEEKQQICSSKEKNSLVTSTDSLSIASSDSPDTSATASTKVSKSSTATSYLPPCRICRSVASGFHYGEHSKHYVSKSEKVLVHRYGFPRMNHPSE